MSAPAIGWGDLRLPKQPPHSAGDFEQEKRDKIRNELRASYLQPSTYGGFDPLDRASWSLTKWVLDPRKKEALFHMLKTTDSLEVLEICLIETLLYSTVHPGSGFLYGELVASKGQLLDLFVSNPHMKALPSESIAAVLRLFSSLPFDFWHAVFPSPSTQRFFQLLLQIPSVENIRPQDLSPFVAAIGTSYEADIGMHLILESPYSAKFPIENTGRFSTHALMALLRSPRAKELSHNDLRGHLAYLCLEAEKGCKAFAEPRYRERTLKFDPPRIANFITAWAEALKIDGACLIAVVEEHPELIEAVEFTPVHNALMEQLFFQESPFATICVTLRRTYALSKNPYWQRLFAEKLLPQLSLETVKIAIQTDLFFISLEVFQAVRQKFHPQDIFGQMELDELEEAFTKAVKLLRTDVLGILNTARAFARIHFSVLANCLKALCDEIKTPNLFPDDHGKRRLERRLCRKVPREDFSQIFHALVEHPNFREGTVAELTDLILFSAEVEERPFRAQSGREMLNPFLIQHPLFQTALGTVSLEQFSKILRTAVTYRQTELVNSLSTNPQFSNIPHQEIQAIYKIAENRSYREIIKILNSHPAYACCVLL